jgi:hypothetical protein
LQVPMGFATESLVCLSSLKATFLLLFQEPAMTACIEMAIFQAFAADPPLRL